MEQELNIFGIKVLYIRHSNRRRAEPCLWTSVAYHYYRIIIVIISDIFCADLNIHGFVVKSLPGVADPTFRN